MSHRAVSKPARQVFSGANEPAATKSNLPHAARELMGHNGSLCGFDRIDRTRKKHNRARAMTGRFCTFAVAVFALLTVIAPARADESGLMTVADLQQFCTASDDGSKNACRFFIFGVAQGMRLVAAAVGDKTHVCIPDDLSAAGMELAVKLAIGQDLLVFPADKHLYQRSRGRARIVATSRSTQ
jgi:hypothetical protein